MFRSPVPQEAFADAARFKADDEGGCTGLQINDLGHEADGLFKKIPVGARSLTAERGEDQQSGQCGDQAVDHGDAFPIANIKNGTQG